MALWKKLASRLLRAEEAVFSQTSRQQPTKIYSADSAFA